MEFQKKDLVKKNKKRKIDILLSHCMMGGEGGWSGQNFDIKLASRTIFFLMTPMFGPFEIPRSPNHKNVNYAFSQKLSMVFWTSRKPNRYRQIGLLNREFDSFINWGNDETHRCCSQAARKIKCPRLKQIRESQNECGLPTKSKDRYSPAPELLLEIPELAKLTISLSYSLRQNTQGITGENEN